MNSIVYKILSALYVIHLALEQHVELSWLSNECDSLSMNNYRHWFKCEVFFHNFIFIYTFKTYTIDAHIFLHMDTVKLNQYYV